MCCTVKYNHSACCNVTAVQWLWKSRFMWKRPWCHDGIHHVMKSIRHPHLIVHRIVLRRSSTPISVFFNQCNILPITGFIRHTMSYVAIHHVTYVYNPTWLSLVNSVKWKSKEHADLGMNTWVEIRSGNNCGKDSLASWTVSRHPGDVGKPLAFLKDDLTSWTKQITGVWSHSSCTHMAAVTMSHSAPVLISSGDRNWGIIENLVRVSIGVCVAQCTYVLHIPPPPHSASCPSASSVSAPVGGRKNTTGASCNGWNHHVCK